ncbi:MAG: ATP-binding protein [Pedobacter sp.]
MSKRLVICFSSFVIVSMVLITATVTVVVTIFTLADLKENRLQNVASHGMDLLEQQLSSLIENVVVFSHNHFVINGLIDPLGRETYLPPLVRDFSSQPGVARLTIVDFTGQTIISSSDKPPNFQIMKELLPVLSVGKSAVLIWGNPKRIMIAEPVEYYNTPQGAVILELDLPFLAAKVLSPSSVEFESLYSSGEIIFTKNYLDSESYVKYRGEPTRRHPLLRQLNIELEVGALLSVYLKPVFRIAFLIGGISLVFICAAIFLSRYLGKSIAHPIEELYRRVERSQYESVRCSPLGTNDEFEALAQSFDRKTDRLLAAEENYRFLFKKNPQPMWVYDLDSLRFLAVNDNALTHYGYCREEFLQMTCLDLLSANDDPADGILERLTEDSEQPKIFHHRRKNGSIIVMDIASHILQFHGRNAELVVAKDVTKQYYVEKALRKSEKKYRLLSSQFQTILNGISEPISLMNSDMQIVWANESYGMSVGCKPRQLRDQFCYFLWHGNTEVCPICPVKVCFETGQINEAKVDTPDGKTWLLKAFPMIDLQGKVVNVIEMASEISEKIRLQRESEQSARLSSLGELVVGLAHEINNPCAILSFNISVLNDWFEKKWPHVNNFIKYGGSVNLVESNCADFLTEIPEMLVDMRESTAKIINIIRELKSFGSMEKIDAFEIHDMNEIINAAVRLTNNVLNKSTDNFEIVLAPMLPKIKASFQQIEQVVINLIINACQALPDRNCKISITTYFDESLGKNVLKIMDEGNGMSPSILMRIQDPFFTTRRDEGGTGLGLSISRRIVENHNGEIHILSEPKKGTQVMVCLPVNCEEGH